MNLLLIAVLILFAGNIIWGYKKGFLRVAYSLVAWILCLAIVSWVSPLVSDLIVSATEVDTTLQQEITTKLQDVVENADVEIKLPEVISSKILGIESAQVEGTTINEILQQTGAYAEVAAKLAMLVINAVSFLVVFILAKVALAIVDRVLGFIHKLPLIGHADKFLGIAAGALKALIITWVIMAVVALLATTESGATVVSAIYGSQPLVWLYENNIILNLMLSFI